jgi:UDP-glucose 4-epimerase
MSGSKKQPVAVVMGANGFIGSHLVDRLASQEQWHIRAYDRFSRAPQFHDSTQVTQIKATIDDNRAIGKALDGAQYLIHTLSATTPFVSDSNPYTDIHSLLRTIEIFEMAIKKGVTKIVFISSGGAVYGRSAEAGVAHEGIVPQPVSPYGICKLSIEYYLEYFKRKYGTEYVVYRLSNPYGPRQIVKQNQGVIPAFLHKIFHDEDITIFGDGSMSRDYIYIEDAVAMIADTFSKPNKHAVYNVGSGQQTTLNEIVSELKRILNKDVSVLYKDAPQTFLHKTTISIERFCEEFGSPRLTSFAEGLSQTITHHLQTEEPEV